MDLRRSVAQARVASSAGPFEGALQQRPRFRRELEGDAQGLRCLPFRSHAVVDRRADSRNTVRVLSSIGLGLLSCSRHASFQRSHVDGLCESEPLVLGLPCRHSADFAHPRIGKPAVFERVIDLWNLTQCSTDADALPRLPGAKPEEAARGVELVRVERESGVLRVADSIREVGHVSAKGAFGAPLEVQQSLDL